MERGKAVPGRAWRRNRRPLWQLHSWTGLSGARRRARLPGYAKGTRSLAFQRLRTPGGRSLRCGHAGIPAEERAAILPAACRGAAWNCAGVAAGLADFAGHSSRAAFFATPIAASRRGLGTCSERDGVVGVGR